MAIDGFDDKISWSEFIKHKKSPKGTDADGFTTARYKLNYTPGRGAGGAIVAKDIRITVFLDSKQSWVVEDKMTDELLKHEQGHYDITALGARDLYVGLLKLKSTSEKALNDSSKELGETLQGKINTRNTRYDEQTDHSQVKAEQEKWNKTIASEKIKSDGSIDNLP